MLFRDCRWSGSNGQAPEQKEVRDKQRLNTAGKGWAGSHVYISVAGEGEDEGGS